MVLVRQGRIGRRRHGDAAVGGREFFYHSGDVIGAKVQGRTAAGAVLDLILKELLLAGAPIEFTGFCTHIAVSISNAVETAFFFYAGYGTVYSRGTHHPVLDDAGSAFRSIVSAEFHSIAFTDVQATDVRVTLVRKT